MPDNTDNLAVVLRQLDLQESINRKDEEAVIALLEQRIAQMLDAEMDLLLSTLYRLDISEEKILYVLKFHKDGPARGFAQLVLERQKEKLRTRREFSRGKSDLQDF